MSETFYGSDYTIYQQARADGLKAAATFYGQGGRSTETLIRKAKLFAQWILDGNDVSVIK